MNSYLFLKITDKNKNNIILKLSKINVKVLAVKEEKDGLIIKILASDYDKMVKYLKTVKMKKIRYTGPLYFKMTLKKYKLVILAIVLAIMIVLFSSFFIVDIRVLHNNEQLVNLILEELEANGIKKFRFAKSFAELQKIKDKIRDQHLDEIDWLEITKTGMKYVVRVEERIMNPAKTEKSYCHVYAKKDGIISSISLTQGEMQVDLGDYVKKDDLLVNGDIHLNDEVVGNVCANAKVYAEVWYTVNVKVPLNYAVKEKTGKVRNNIVINYDGIDHQLFKDRLENFTSSKKQLFNLLKAQEDIELKYLINKFTTIKKEDIPFIDLPKVKVRTLNPLVNNRRLK